MLYLAVEPKTASLNLSSVIQGNSALVPHLHNLESKRKVLSSSASTLLGGCVSTVCCSYLCPS